MSLLMKQHTAISHLALYDIVNTPGIGQRFYAWDIVKFKSIGLITVSDAILTGRQSGQKLQCLYGNPMAKNFFQNRILHKL